MSLINQVLTDLDARRAGGGEAGKLPAGVRPVAAHRPDNGRRATDWVAALVVGALVAAGGGWLLLSGAPDRTAATALPAGIAAAPAPASRAAAPETTSLQALSPDSTPAQKPVAAQTHSLAPASGLATPAAPVSAPVPPASAAVVPAVGEPTPRRVTAPPPREPRIEAPADKVATPEADKVDASRAETTAARVDKVAREADPAARASDRYQKALRDAAQGRQVAAIAGMGEALAIDPSAAEIRQTLLRMLLEQGDHAAAERLLGDGLQRDPTRSDWVLLLSRLQLERGDQAAASALLDAMLARQPGNAEVAAALGAVLHTQQRYAEAAQRYRRAIEIEGNNGRYWLGLALAHDAAGAAGEARQAFTRALDSGTLSADLAAYARGRLR